MADRYNPFEAEPAWQAAWLRHHLVTAAKADDGEDRRHVGDLRAPVMADVLGRWRRARGESVAVRPVGALGRRLGLVCASPWPDPVGAMRNETYRSQDGEPLDPDAVIVRGTDGRRRASRLHDGTPVDIGPVRPMAWANHNAVAAEEIVAVHGADALRLFLLADTPPERALLWVEDRVQAAARLPQKLHRLVGELALLRDAPSDPAIEGPNPRAIRDAVRQATAALDADLERGRFHRGVAHLHALAGTLARAVGEIETAELPVHLAEAFGMAADTLVRLAAPFTPHVAETAWVRLGHHTLAASATWPLADPSPIVRDMIDWAVQVDGRKRADMSCPAGTEAAAVEAAALALAPVRRALAGRPPKKVIVVPRGLVNVVS